MARPGHGRSRSSLKEDEDEEGEDPLDALISRTGCMGQHRALQDCMAQRQDWRHCQPQVRAFGECMARRQRRAPEPPSPQEPNRAQPSPAPD
ncbi:cytochrome c oxidase assembly factor 4 homolog, mitochondrial [Indicator indicator]|nr:cytochrome c oxidase assembly factor 4 homolog, mitochondrial [Indicator indicator]